MKEEQLREDQRREALARRDDPAMDEPRHEEPKREEPRHEEARHVEPAPAPVAEAIAPPPAPAPRPRPEQPKVDPKEVLESAGLVMIETDRSKAAPAPVVEEPVHLGRPRRERPKTQAEDAPLEQVETRK